MDGRLVEQQDARVLSDGHGEHRQLALTERQLAHIATAQVADADALDGGVDAHAIGGPGSEHPMLVRYPAQCDQLLDQNREGDDRLARDDGHEMGQLMTVDRS